MTWSKPIGFSALLAMMVACFQISAPATAKYWGAVDMPDWSAATGYSRQSWGFGIRPDWQKTDLDHDGDKDACLLQPNGYGADVHADNAYGGAFFIGSDFGDASAWDWINQGPMMRDWKGLQGMIGGMGTGSFDFMVPGPAASDGTRQIWIQAVVYLSNGQDGSATKTVLAADRDFTRARGRLEDKQWQRINQLDDRGSGGQWWRITELWRIGSPGPVDYIRIGATRGSVAMIDSVDILTRTVDVDQADKEEASRK